MLCPTNTTLLIIKKVGHNGVRYKECLKNHAAVIGGTATDGCGKFMPNGEEGTIKALKGLNRYACNCHRKEVEGEQHQQLSFWDHNFHHTINKAVGVGSRKILLNHAGGGGHHKRSIPSDQFDEQEDHHRCRHDGGSHIDTGVWKLQALLIFNFICLNQ
ncbi:hypothetical protein ACFX15_018298 [Malus domestica]